MTGQLIDAEIFKYFLHLSLELSIFISTKTNLWLYIYEHIHATTHKNTNNPQHCQVGHGTPGPVESAWTTWS